MLVTRCEWHRSYWGYAAYTGYKRDGRWRVALTGGICPACAAVLRGRGVPGRAASVGREIGRVAVALTAFAAWALVVLLAGCDGAPVYDVGACLKMNRSRPESWDKTIIIRVEERGRRAYRTRFWSDQYGWMDTDHIVSYDHPGDWSPIPCPSKSAASSGITAVEKCTSDARGNLICEAVKP